MIFLLVSDKNGDKACNRTNFNELRYPVKNGADLSTITLSSQSQEKSTEAEVLKVRLGWARGPWARCGAAPAKETD